MIDIQYPRSPGPRRILLGMVTLLLSTAIPVAAQSDPNTTQGGTSATPMFRSAPTVTDDSANSLFNQGVFRFESAARQHLHALWIASLQAQQERVACLSGYAQDSIIHITNVELLVGGSADSANISAVAALRKCSPPTFFGTVHTHIITVAGQPVIMFSGADRGVNDLWRRRWGPGGVFCIIYSETQAHCERGYTLDDYAYYGVRRGSDILF